MAHGASGVAPKTLLACFRTQSPEGRTGTLRLAMPDASLTVSQIAASFERVVHMHGLVQLCAHLLQRAAACARMLSSSLALMKRR